MRKNWWKVFCRIYLKNAILLRARPELCLLINLSLLSACTHFSNSNTSRKNLSLALKQICLSGQGKGRIQSLDERYLFAFESLWSRKKSWWKLGVDIPMQGQKLLLLKYRDAFTKKVKLQGALAKEIQSSESSEQTVILQKLGQFLWWQDQMTPTWLQQKCEFSANHSQGRCYLDGKNAFTFDLTEGIKIYMGYKHKKITLTASQKDELGFFRKLSLSMKRFQDFGPRSIPFRLDLFLSSCSLAKN